MKINQNKLPLLNKIAIILSTQNIENMSCLVNIDNANNVVHNPVPIEDTIAILTLVLFSILNPPNNLLPSDCVQLRITELFRLFYHIGMFCEVLHFFLNNF